METIFEELKTYVGFGPADEAALEALHPLMRPDMEAIAELFYDRILANDGARQVLRGGEEVVGRLKVTLVDWMDLLLKGPWDQAYFERRCRIGRVHVRIAMPQHYMFGAMNVIRAELSRRIDERVAPAAQAAARLALDRILDLELAIMLHTYREDLESQQKRSERLATFGQLVGSIGHELRNPLGVIESSLYILRGRAADDPRLEKHLGRIGDQVKIANSIISALLDMIRDRPLKLQPVKLADVLDEALAQVARPPGVAVSVEGVDGLPPVAGDAGQLRQVLVNLLANGYQALKGHGRVWVVGEAGPREITLRIEDDGPAVSPEIRARIFEPLVSDKVQGIGLGLALVRRIIERHNGRIGYQERPGGGAAFVIQLPHGT
jgi:signal transduction histidine kinase